MKTEKEIKAALNTIRSVIDIDPGGCDISDVKEKLFKLNSLMGLSAETMASAKKMVNEKEIEVFSKMPDTMAPSIASKFLAAHCKEENAVFVYSDRLNSSIVHQIDSLRTIISLYKTEMESSLRQ